MLSQALSSESPVPVQCVSWDISLSWTSEQFLHWTCHHTSPTRKAEVQRGQAVLPSHTQERDELGLTSKGSCGTQPLFYRCQESLPAENLFSLNSGSFPLSTRDYHRSSQLPSHKATSGLLPWAFGLWRGSLGSCLLTEPSAVQAGK